MDKNITGKEIAIIVPTFNRPKKITDFLNSLVNQTVSCGRVIIVDGGKSIKEIVDSYSGQLPIEYYHCQPPGQIRQRNFGISLIDEKTPIVGFFDDDIVLENTALEEMVAFWNRCDNSTAGVACNVVSERAHSPVWYRRIFCLDTDRAGAILKSGANTPTSNVRTDLKTDWLPGGATFWRTDIHKKYHHAEIYAKRAYCEDLIFSYPISKEHSLYICSTSRVRHEYVQDHVKHRVEQYYGRVDVLWRLYFITKNDDLYLRWFIWMYIGITSFDLMRGIFLLRPHLLHRALGRLQGLSVGLWALLLKKELADVIDER